MKTEVSDSKKGVVYGVISALTFAVYVFINKYVYINYSVKTLNYVATFMIAGGLFAGISLLYSAVKKKSLKTRVSAWPVVANGLIAGVGLGTFVFGQSYTTAVNAGILATSTVITTIFFSRLILKDSLNKSKMLFVIAMFVGLYLAIVGVHGLHLNEGDVIILASAVVLGFTNVFSKILMKQRSSRLVSDGRLASGGVLFIAIGLLTGGSSFLVTSAGLWPLLAGFFFWLTIKTFYASVKYIGPNNAIILTDAQPIITPVAGVFLLSESYTLEKFIGSAIVLMSVYFINKK